MQPINDQNCGWINSLPIRPSQKILNGTKKCDWIIIGAGLTGLSAARQLGALHPNQKIILADA